ncbi:glycosyltransferase family 2 protein [Daejeonella sp. H1SJ63]|uniref:glycosyltransferase family 2 protein n=1 Tax=Daejeonella sp. H1SJ63 TaxID=3034145 RepID=UPI0023EB88A7|nr:glycosyltransferase family 2 protein [Daejeonella sp. H1SJ63]
MIKTEQRISEYPSISVAMATYNGEKYLEEQLDSILSQTLKPVEIIVCDDQSTDGTIEILERYCRGGLLSYYVNENRLGFIGNFKKAVSLCAPANYIALSDQDDVWLPSKLELAAEYLQKIDDAEHPVMVYSDLILVDQDKNIINNSFRDELGQGGYHYCLGTLFFGCFVNGCTMLMNPAMRTYFSTIPENGTLNHDTWMSMIAYTFGKAEIVPDPQIYYRSHRNNATDVGDFKRKGRFTRLFSEIVHSFKKNDLFEDQISFASEFYQVFQDKLSKEQDELFKRFLKLKGKSYLEKKIALRMFFRGKWK